MRYARVAVTLLLLATSQPRMVSQAGQIGNVGTATIRRALDEGRYAEAERLAADRVAARQQDNDLKGTAQESDLLVEALIKNGKIGEPSTLSLAERVIADKTALFGSSSAELANSLDNLGSLSSERGEFATAVATHRQALAIRRQAEPSNGARLADTLERLALPLIWLERFTEAQRAVDEARRIRESLSEQLPLDLARTLYLDALLHRWDGRYDLATAALSEVSQIRFDLAPDHPDNVAVFELNGDLLFLKGSVRQAEQAWTQGLALA